MPSQSDVVIVGAGIAGLTAALALAQRDFTITLLEARDAATEIGAGIQLGPNATTCLAALGLRDAIASHATAPAEIAVRSGRSGRLIQSLPLGPWIAERHGAPYLVTTRQDLHRALLNAATAKPTITILPGAKVDHVADLTATAATGELHTANHCVIVADGIWSRLHTALTDRSAPLQFSGKRAARTLINTDAAPEVLRANAVGTWLSPSGHLVHYPVANGRQIALVVVSSNSDATQDWSRAMPTSAAVDCLTEIAPPLDHGWAADADWRSWPLYERAPAYTTTQPGTVMIGDAAHPVLPFLAQGAALAIEDAMVLAGELARADRTPEAAIASFVTSRTSRAAAVAKAAKNNGRIFHLSGPGAFARDTALGLMGGDRAMARYDWLYGWKPPMQ
ncbi:MAG: FAD-dependent oxidoreductase [Pseudomonadota bacterium]